MVQPSRYGDCQVAGLQGDEKQVVCVSDHDSHVTFGNCYAASRASSSLSSPLELELQYTVAVSDVSSTVALLCSSGSPDSKPARCQLLDVSSGSPKVVGHAVEIRSEEVVDISTEVLNFADHTFACCYIYKSGDDTLQECKVITVSVSTDQLETGDAIQVGNEEPIGDPVSSMSLAQFDNDKVLLTWTRWDGGVYATVLTSDGDVLRSAEEFRISTSQARYVATAPVYLNEAIACWNGYEEGKWRSIHCLNVLASSGTSLSAGEQYLLRQSADDIESLAMAPIGARDSLLCYLDNTDEICNMLRSSGSQVLAGDELVHDGSQHSQLCVTRVSSSSAYLCSKPPDDPVSCRSLTNLKSASGSLTAVEDATSTSTTDAPSGWPWWAWLLLLLIPLFIAATAVAAYMLVARRKKDPDTATNGSEGKKEKKKKDKSSRERESRSERDTSYSPEPPTVPRGRSAGRGGLEQSRFGEYQASYSSSGSSSSEDEQQTSFFGFPVRR
mmetsp:Transcript_44875/g.106475  ORF Transcript_44875/g.106475 Transcript_44875/m.106475 type:complete len:499 (+) Transcript_44875:103-1599(+)